MNIHGNTGNCRSCGARIIWAITEGAKKPMCLHWTQELDVRYVARKNAVIVEPQKGDKSVKRFFNWKGLCYCRDTYKKRPDCFDEEGNPVEPMEVIAYETHWQHCPDAEKWKKKKQPKEEPKPSSEEDKSEEQWSLF